MIEIHSSVIDVTGKPYLQEGLLVGIFQVAVFSIRSRYSIDLIRMLQRDEIQVDTTLWLYILISRTLG